MTNAKALKDMLPPSSSGEDRAMGRVRRGIIQMQVLLGGNPT